MPDPNLTRINGVPYSWTSLSHFFSGVPYRGVVAANWKETRDGEVVHAAEHNGVAIGITSGLYNIENLSFTLLTDSATGLMTDLSTLGEGSFGDAEWTYVGQLFEPPPFSIGPSLPVLPVTTIISGCRITGVEEKWSVESKASVTEFTCKALRLVRRYAGVPLNLWSDVRTFQP